MTRKLALLLCAFIFLPSAIASDLTDLSNYRQYSEHFASSGQPTSDHLKLLAEDGVKRVIYLAYTDNDTAIAAEDRKVLELGMEYAHIPVDFMNPTLKDFQHFAAVMQTAPAQKTLVHCQINLRASAFSFLYRVVHENVPVATALEDMHSVWAPNDIWFDFIQNVAEHYDKNLFCDTCDWGGREVENAQ